MDKRAAIILIALGVLTASPFALSVLGQFYGMNPFLAYLLPTLSGPICGLILICWGVYGLTRKRPNG